MHHHKTVHGVHPTGLSTHGKERNGPVKSTRQGSSSFGLLENASVADEPEK
jgi:hypothetical protein